MKNLTGRNFAEQYILFSRYYYYFYFSNGYLFCNKIGPLAGEVFLTYQE
jgi:hypothetical protein